MFNRTNLIINNYIYHKLSSNIQLVTALIPIIIDD